MGNLHQGHLDLVTHAGQIADHTVVSIFVNPMQFGPNEDFDAYPRTLADDQARLADSACQVIFAPTVRDIYPHGVRTEIDVPALSTILCGHHRPGHFRGVATVVTKLLNIVQPDVAVFGNKDYQQLQVIQTVATDLLLPLEIIGVDTTREPSGLAMSSRNAYLTADERVLAASLYQSLQTLAAAVQRNHSVASTLREEKARLTALGFVLDYLDIRDANDLTRSGLEADTVVILVAAKLGHARLIDNVVVNTQ
jgi:pantoate--beta-alanine ligase